MTADPDAGAPVLLRSWPQTFLRGLAVTMIGGLLLWSLWSEPQSRHVLARTRDVLARGSDPISLKKF